MGEALALGGGAAGIFAFVLAMTQILSSSRLWRDLIAEIRRELTECRDDRERDRAERERERGEFNQKILSLEGEVISLRRTVHEDRWLGVDPAARKEHR